jgi:2'-5' RNA ligase
LIDGSLAELAIPREAHVFTPHLTLARGPGGSGSPARQKGDQPNRSFHELQEYLRTVLPPEFGSITVGEFFLYQSRLSPTGSRYTKLAAYPLS